MTNPREHFVRVQLDRLRAELVELAFQLDRRGRPEAADVAMTTSARLAELGEALAAEEFSGACPGARVEAGERTP